MYLAFANDTSSGYFYIGVVSAARAHSLARWLEDNTNSNNDLTLSGIPVLYFSEAGAQASDYQVAQWKMGKLSMMKTITHHWRWASGKHMLPPIRGQPVRTFFLSVDDSRSYTCIGFVASGIPILDPVPGPTQDTQRQFPAHLVNVARINTNAGPSSLRKATKRPRDDDPDLNGAAKHA